LTKESVPEKDRSKGEGLQKEGPKKEDLSSALRGKAEKGGGLPCRSRKRKHPPASADGKKKKSKHHPLASRKKRVFEKGREKRAFYRPRAGGRKKGKPSSFAP